MQFYTVNEMKTVIACPFIQGRSNESASAINQSINTDLKSTSESVCLSRLSDVCPVFHCCLLPVTLPVRKSRADE